MNTNITDLIDAAFGIVNTILIPLSLGLCVLYFFWGVAKYVRAGAESEEAAKEGRRVMLWGIVGLFVVFSIWGIVTFIRTELGIPDIEKVEKPIN